MREVPPERAENANPDDIPWRRQAINQGVLQPGEAANNIRREEFISRLEYLYSRPQIDSQCRRWVPDFTPQREVLEQQADERRAEWAVDDPWSEVAPTDQEEARRKHRNRRNHIDIARYQLYTYIDDFERESRVDDEDRLRPGDWSARHGFSHNLVAEYAAEEPWITEENDWGVNSEAHYYRSIAGLCFGQDLQGPPAE